MFLKIMTSYGNNLILSGFAFNICWQELDECPMPHEVKVFQSIC